MPQPKPLAGPPRQAGYTPPALPNGRISQPPVLSNDRISQENYAKMQQEMQARDKAERDKALGLNTFNNARMGSMLDQMSAMESKIREATPGRNAARSSAPGTGPQIFDMSSRSS